MSLDLSGLMLWLDAAYGVPRTHVQPEAGSQNLVPRIEDRAGVHGNLSAVGSSTWEPASDLYGPGAIYGPCISSDNGGSGSFQTLNLSTFNRRSFSLFLIWDQTTLRAGRGDDILFQSGNKAPTTTCGINSTTRKLFCGATNQGNVNCTSFDMLVPSSRCLIGFVGDQKEFRFYVNGNVEKKAPMISGVFNQSASFSKTVQTRAFREIRMYDRPFSDDEVFSSMLPWARSLGVCTEYDTTIVYDGGSIMAGYKTSTHRSHAERHRLQRVRHYNVALNGCLAETMQAQGAQKVDIFLPPKGKRVAAICGGTNDINGQMGTARSAVDTYGYLTGWQVDRKAAGWEKTIIHTQLPRTDNTPAENVQLALLVDMILDNAAGFDYVIDYTNEPLLADAHNRAVFHGDGIHPVDFGEQVMADVDHPTIKAAVGI